VSTSDNKSLLVVLRHSPYGSSLARAAVDTALAAAAFEQPVKLLFMGDGVLQLLPEQDSQGIGVKNIGRLLSSLPLYDIESVYVDAEAATRYAIELESTPVPAQLLDGAGMHQLLLSCDHIVGF
jgi:tRNA 2-thiouridine synthesizing protein C